MSITDKISSEQAQAFYVAISAAKNEGKQDEINKEVFNTKDSKWFGAYVHTHEPKEYAEVDQLHLLEGSEGGFAIKSGDIISVFKHPKVKRSLLGELIPKAIQMGGTHLDCFNGILPTLYSKFKFMPVSKVKFNREFAPEDWNYARDEEPDIIFMIFKENVVVEDDTEKRATMIKNEIKHLEYSESYEKGQSVQLFALKEQNT